MQRPPRQRRLPLPSHPYFPPWAEDLTLVQPGHGRGAGDSDSTAGRRECRLLDVYLCTIGRFIPLVEPLVLMHALQQRQHCHRVSSEQAQVGKPKVARAAM